MAGPVDEGDDARPAFIKGTFSIAVGAVVAGNDDLAHVGDTAGELRTAGAAIVGLEDDEGVLADTFLFEGLHDTPYLIVQRGDASRVCPATGISNTLVTVEVLLGRLVGGVRSIEGEIEIERFREVVVVDELDGIVAQQGGGVTRLNHFLVVAVPVNSVMLFMREVINLADERAI